MAGIGSRREADDLITAGLITVNGTLVTELGSKVKQVTMYGITVSVSEMKSMYISC
jgi:16S rRNA U516 pseudouridylate synthase RsuA-like enzyme